MRGIAFEIFLNLIKYIIDSWSVKSFFFFSEIIEENEIFEKFDRTNMKISISTWSNWKISIWSKDDVS